MHRLDLWLKTLSAGVLGAALGAFADATLQAILAMLLDEATMFTAESLTRIARTGAIAAIGTAIGYRTQSPRRPWTWQERERKRLEQERGGY